MRYYTLNALHSSSVILTLWQMCHPSIHPTRFVHTVCPHADYNCEGMSLDVYVLLALWSIYPMMTSSNGNIFRVTGLLCGEVTGEFPAQRPVTRALMFSVICAWINSWVNNREAGDLRRHRTQYDVSVMLQYLVLIWPMVSVRRSINLLANNIISSIIC